MSLKVRFPDDEARGRVLGNWTDDIITLLNRPAGGICRQLNEVQKYIEGIYNIGYDDGKKAGVADNLITLINDKDEEDA